LLTLREEHRLRRIFGPKRGKVTGGWRKTHNEELNDVCLTVKMTAPSGPRTPHS